MHTLANDPGIPANIRRAFSRVSCQLVLTYGDGTQGIVNMVDRDRAEAEASLYRPHIGTGPRFWNRGKTARVALLAVNVREVR